MGKITEQLEVYLGGSIGNKSIPAVGSPDMGRSQFQVFYSALEIFNMDNVSNVFWTREGVFSATSTIHDIDTRRRGTLRAADGP